MIRQSNSAGGNGQRNLLNVMSSKLIDLSEYIMINYDKASRRHALIWRFRNSVLVISSELHEKISRSCKRIDQVPSEILNVRRTRAPIFGKHKKRGCAASEVLEADSTRKVAAAAGG